ncbi:pyruvate, water dikinase regulatory protein [Paenibacillus turpanensis]|uniref:pyruvate, water dikinase regulatory protein n=1 Tax=Paenibacillus turpanensis TaxID=2689078 RepID=UPI00140A76EE|nr:pyruvate, water dikinase regulatory protein [Paenibacillus turpanensis]
MSEKPYVLFLLSDSLGETAEAVAKATIRQFNAEQVKIRKFGHIRYEAEIRTILDEAARTGGFVAYTLVQPHLREVMREEALRLSIRTVDIMGPMMQAFIDTYDDSPKRQPGLLHKMDEDYFRRVEAIEFAVRADDGRDPSCLLEAQIVLVGVSRTSKTPLSVFLAHKGYKVANLPLIPEVKLPKELFHIDSRKIIGLTMNEEQMLKIRNERLKTLGLPANAQYATRERIREELQYARSLAEKLGCTLLDVTDNAIEETANVILELLQQG